MSYSPAAGRLQGWRLAGILAVATAMVMAVLTLSPTGSVEAQAAPATCYAINDQGGNEIMLSLSGGGVSSLGATGLLDIESLAANNDAQELWTYDDATGTLYSFTPGSATPSTEVAFATGDLDGLTWVNHNDGNPADDQLWGVIRNGLNDDVNVADEIVQINPATGAEISRVTFVDPGAGSDELDDLDGLVWDPVSGDIYSVIGGDTTNNRLITINPATGAILTSVEIAPATTDVEGLAVDLSGNLYAITGDDPSTPNNFYSLTAAGAITQISSVAAQGGDFEGLACIEPIGPPLNLTPVTCYTIDEGAGNAGGDGQNLIQVDVAADGSISLSDLGLVPNAVNIENLAYRNGFSPDALYAHDASVPNGSGDLITLDETDGTQTTFVANVSGVDVDGFTFRNDNDGDPSNDELWGIIRQFTPTADQIVQLNPATGAIVSGPTTITGLPAGAENDDVDAIAWDATTDTFYAVIGGDSTSNSLITLTAGGAAAVVGDTGVLDIEGLAVDDDGQMFAQVGEDGAQADNFYLVDKANASTTLLGNLASTGFTDFESLDCAGNAVLVENPVIGLAKALTSGPTINGAGNYDLQFTFTVENHGNVDLSNVTLADDFAEYAAAGSVVSGPNEVSNSCPNPLPVDGVCAIVWAVEVDVPPGDYNNSATVTGTSPLSVDVTDISDDGLETDTDGDDNPNEPGENDPTPATIPVGPENPVIGLAKDLTSGPTENGAGNWDLEFTFNIENLGDVELTNVTLADDFAEYAAAGTIVSGPNEVSNNCPDPHPVGATCQVVWAVEVDVPAGTYNNSATVTGTSPLLVDVTDISNDGIEPDENDNDDPTDPEDETPTPATIPDPAENPAIGLAKDLTFGPTINGAGNYDLQFSFLVENLGDVALTNITLADTFAEYAAAGTIVSGPNELFNDCPATLAVAGTCAIVWAIEVDVPVGTYNNSATVTGTSPASVDVTDISDDGVVPDTDGDGNADEPGENDPTPAVITAPAENPVIGLAKDLTAGPTLNGSDNYDLEFTFNIENLGDVELTNVTLADDFAEYAAAGTIVSGPNEVSNNCPDPHPVGATCQVVWAVEVDVPAGTYNNSATVTGTSPQSVDVTDISNDGIEPDENDNDDPTDPEDETPTPAIIPAAGTATIGDFVFNDLNADGIQDPGEPGLEGVTVQVYPVDGAGVPIGAPTNVVTGADGSWSLSGVAPGDYRFAIVLPAGAIGFSPQNAGPDGIDSDVAPTGPDTSFSDVYTLTAGENNDTLDAGILFDPVPAVIGDLVFEDTNGNGLQDAGEPGIPNVVVQAVDAGDNVVAQTTTGADGDWLLTVPPGTYTIRFTNPTAGDFTLQDAGDETLDSDVDATGVTAPITVIAGETNPTIDAGILPEAAAVIGDLLFEDTDGNGLQDAGEPGIAGATVSVLDAGNNVVASTVTGADGTWSLTVPAGTYTVQFENTIGGTFTLQDAGDDTLDSDVDATGTTAAITVNAGQNDFTIDAGIIPPPDGTGSISNLVFEDVNQNGLQDAGEPGVPNVTVIVRDENGLTVGTDVSAADGTYLVGNLPAGDYTVQFVPPGALTFTIQDAGDDTLDSDPDPTTGITATITLGDGENNTSVDAGVIIPDDPENPSIGLAKTVADGPTLNAAGNYVVTYSFVIENLGDVDLINVTLTDDFTATFPGATIVSGPTPNGGDCSAEVATGTGALAVGESCTAVWDIEVDGLVPGTVYNNTAVASGVSPQATTVTDISDDGVNPDPNGNDDPADPDEDDPTPVTVPENPQIGLAKRLVSGPTQNGDGNFDMTFSFVLENLGNVDLTDVTLTDDFAATFDPATVVSGPTPNGGTCSAAVAAGTGALAVGESCIAVWDVEVNGLEAGVLYLNTATATGTSPMATVVTDISDNGVEPDPNGNDDPSDPGEEDPTPIQIPSTPPGTCTSNDGVVLTGSACQPPLEYTGPFNNAPVTAGTTFEAPNPEPADTAPLAITGSNSTVLASLAILALGLGGALTIGARRKRDEI